MAMALQLLARNIYMLVFLVGLTVLCGSVAQWSKPAAGVIAGLVLMTAAVAPLFLNRRTK
jgi:hypothetical protein